MDAAGHIKLAALGRLGRSTHQETKYVSRRLSSIAIIAGLNV